MQHTARYTFQIEDYRALLAAAQAQRRFGRWTPYVQIALTFLLAGFVGLLAGSIGSGKLPRADKLGEVVGFSLIIMVVGTAIFALLLRPLQGRGFKKLSVAGQAMLYDLTPEKLSWARAGMTGQMVWQSVRAVDRQSDAIVLMISGVEGIVLPKRAFATEAAFQAATEMVTAVVGTAASPTATPAGTIQ